MNHVKTYLKEAREIIDRIDKRQIERLVSVLKMIRKKKGRLFFLGVGGGAAHASHAVNDFRKICGFEAYAPTDNVAELSARVNDDGWETVFVRWLEQSRLGPGDGIFIFSVGGGSLEKNISANLVQAIDLAKKRKSKVLGIVGRDGGYTARRADAFILVPVVNAESVTPHTEAFQAVLWHLLISHPDLKALAMKWESVKP
ncbi:MAG: SIS domain-containing protein [Candidatus Aminicenantes bacterium]|nr:SIS domain-containing protein [Candidatus Aminicenantes bacterium]